MEVFYLHEAFSLTIGMCLRWTSNSADIVFWAKWWIDEQGAPRLHVEGHLTVLVVVDEKGDVQGGLWVIQVKGQSDKQWLEMRLAEESRYAPDYKEPYKNFSVIII